MLNPGAVAVTRTGRYAGGRFGNLKGPLDIAVSYGKSTTGDSYYAATTDSVKIANLGASYDLCILKLFGETSRAKQARDVEVTPLRGAWLMSI